MSVTVITDSEATAVYLAAKGAVASLVSLSRTSPTTFIGQFTVSGASGECSVVAYATNSFGTVGDEFSAAILLDQTAPSITNISVDYPPSQTALNVGESATVHATVSNADAVTYTGTNLDISSPTIYKQTKTVSHAGSGYVTLQCVVTATYAPTNAVTTQSIPIKIATVAPTASISIQSNPSRLIGSPSGVSYNVVITPSQTLSVPPSLTASLGMWAGSWTQSQGNWIRPLVIYDSTNKGTGLFSGLSMTGPTNIAGDVITAGSTYIVGGMTTRTITYPAFARVAPIGAQVANESKTVAQYVGGSTLTRYSNNDVHTAGYYIANVDGSYNATGTYLGLSDSAFAGSNTTGTLQVVFGESE